MLCVACTFNLHPSTRASLPYIYLSIIDICGRGIFYKGPLVSPSFLIMSDDHAKSTWFTPLPFVERTVYCSEGSTRWKNVEKPANPPTHSIVCRNIQSSLFSRVGIRSGPFPLFAFHSVAILVIHDSIQQRKSRTGADDLLGWDNDDHDYVR